jgi:hypothetical protein
MNGRLNAETQRRRDAKEEKTSSGCIHLARLGVVGLAIYFVGNPQQRIPLKRTQPIRSYSLRLCVEDLALKD